MRITLEKPDLVGILSKAFGYTLSENDITVQADPFEVHIQNVNVGELATAAGKSETEEPETDNTEPESQEEEEITEKSTLTLEELLGTNELLKEKKTAQPSVVERPLGPEEFYEAPPVTTTEFEALKRIANRPRSR